MKLSTPRVKISPSHSPHFPSTSPQKTLHTSFFRFVASAGENLTPTVAYLGSRCHDALPVRRQLLPHHLLLQHLADLIHLLLSNPSPTSPQQPYPPCATCTYCPSGSEGWVKEGLTVRTELKGGAIGQWKLYIHFFTLMKCLLIVYYNDN